MSSSTSMVAAFGPTDSNPQGARHQCQLQLRWWPLPDPTGSTPKGPTIDILK
jgi:hypothetical protein